MATGSAKRSAKRATAAQAGSDQRLPPSSRIGRSAAHSSFCSRLMSVADALAAEPVETWPGLTDMSHLQKMLWAAQRPIMLLGGSRWSAAASAAVARFAERFALPVATTFRRAHLFDPYHACYAGDLGIGPNPKLLARVKGADLILLVGGRLGEMPSQSYTLIDIPGPRQTLVHVFPGIEELGRVYAPQLAINAAPTAFAAALEGLQPPNEIKWRGETPSAHADFLAWTDKPTTVRSGWARFIATADGRP